MLALAELTAALQQSQRGHPLPQALQAFHHSLLCPEGCSTGEASAGTLTSDHQAEHFEMPLSMQR